MSFRNTKISKVPGTKNLTYSAPRMTTPELVDLSTANVPITEESVAESESMGDGYIQAKRLGTGQHPILDTDSRSQDAPESISSDQMVRPSTPHGRPFVRGNKAARGRKPKLAMLGVDLKYLNITDERYKSALRRAEFYLKRRTRELSVMFGFSSAGVNGILGSAALQLAASKYLSQLAAEHAGVDMSMYIELQKMAIQLMNSAKANELAAYELCAKESAATKKAIKSAAPWLEGMAQMDEESK